MIKIQLLGPDGVFNNTLIDDDCKHLLDYQWWAHRAQDGSKVYASRKTFDENGNLLKTYYMHREITQCPTGLIVDHLNGNALDNRKLNLRVCNNKENSQNSKRNKKITSRGIKWSKKDGNAAYEASYVSSGKNRHGGKYLSKEDAILARDLLCIQFCGEFAGVNMPQIFEPLVAIVSIHGTAGLEPYIAEMLQNLAEKRIAKSKCDLSENDLKTSLPLFLSVLEKIQTLRNELESFCNLI